MTLCLKVLDKIENLNIIPMQVAFNPIQNSKKTDTQQEKYTNYELKMLAINEYLKEFKKYLGRKFKMFTDCSAFQQTMSI